MRSNNFWSNSTQAQGSSVPITRQARIVEIYSSPSSHVKSFSLTLFNCSWTFFSQKPISISACVTSEHQTHRWFTNISIIIKVFLKNGNFPGREHCSPVGWVSPSPSPSITSPSPSTSPSRLQSQGGLGSSGGWVQSLSGGVLQGSRQESCQGEISNKYFSFFIFQLNFEGNFSIMTYMSWCWRCLQSLGGKWKGKGDICLQSWRWRCQRRLWWRWKGKYEDEYLIIMMKMKVTGEMSSWWRCLWMMWGGCLLCVIINGDHTNEGSKS